MITFIEIPGWLTDAPYYQVLKQGKMIGRIIPAGIASTFLYRSEFDTASESALLPGLEYAKEYARLFCCEIVGT